MKQQKRNKSKQQQKKRKHTVHFSHIGWVTLPPSRERQTPFCAYYGPNGETCSEATGLQMVYALPSTPRVMYCACPSHYEAVSQMVQAFLARLEKLSKRV